MRDRGANPEDLMAAGRARAEALSGPFLEQVAALGEPPPVERMQAILAGLGRQLSTEEAAIRARGGDDLAVQYFLLGAVATLRDRLGAARDLLNAPAGQPN